jgi:CRISPR-associated protein Csm3
MRLISKKILAGKLTLLSGLHIGDSKEAADIGGVDSPVVRRKDNKVPYIPGSSLKGKLRCLLEQQAGITEVGGGSGQISTAINQLFGITEQKKSGTVVRQAQLSRIIVRDADMTNKSVQKFLDLDTDMPYTEIKFENTIDRVKGAAKNGGIRQIERVPAGAEFDIEFIMNIYEGDDEQALIELLKKGIHLLENDYLGGSGTRGYGNVTIALQEPQTVFQHG